MDILSQIYLDVAVLVLGLVFGLPYRLECNSFLYVAISWFVGWAIVVLSVIFAVIAGIYVTLSTIVCFSIFSVLLFWLIRGRSRNKLFLFPIKAGGSRTFAILTTVSILFICLAAYFGNFVVYTTDSLQIEAMSRMFNKFGNYSELTTFTSSFFITRMPFYVAVNSIAYLMGIDIFYSFMTVTLFFVCVGLLGFWKSENDISSCLSAMWLLLVIFLFLSNNLLIYHSFYKHTNLTTMAYYLFGVMSVYKYLEGKDSFWFFFACFFLGCTGILRAEMLVFSVIPFGFLAWKRNYPKFKTALGGLIIYSLVIYPWFLWGFYLLKSNYKVLEFISNIKYVGFLACFSFFCMLAAFIVSKRTIRENLLIPLTTIVLSCVAYGIYYFRNNLIFSIKGLIYIMFKSKDMFWESFWYLACFGLAIYIVSKIKFLSLKLFNIGSSKHLNQFKYGLRLDFLFFVIIVFILGRIIIYSMPAACQVLPYRTHSSNRMLLHIYPVAVYFLGRLGYIYSRRVLNEKNINNNSRL